MSQQAKALLRAVMLQRRDAMNSDVRSDLCGRITVHFVALARRLGCRRVGLYAAVRSEVATALLHTSLLGLGIDIVYPRMLEHEKRLEFAPASLAELKPNRLGIPEPTAPAIDLASVELLAVPGVAFDLQGSRVGYGAGYYDRTLVNYQQPAVGLGFGLQLVDEIPNGPHDHPLTAVVTEEGVLWAETEAGAGR